ncbi:hypothetical protein B1756_09870 [Natrarchaeobaculum aegyptiacum]|uniref:CARDB domain-containing protein n=1 Tax=Natrarchaeobaculum aegyptiacum TaxID=745377 RepID=A0A2Z2HV16_9EURY|nr:hypothetical protein B1756_09870 [Natrarchaeobaculum aegyptiacum]
MILFGLVILGAALVFVSGSAMIDALESEADRERLSLCIDETDHRLGTVAGTGHEMPLDFDDPSCQSELIEDGVIEVVWYNDSPDWDDNVSTELNALEFESDGQTVAHQGGGIWEDTGDEIRVISDPAIQYDNETLQFNLMALEEGDLEGSTPIARANHSQASDFSDEVMDEARLHENIAFRVDSSYHDGWNRSLHDTLGSGVHPGVTIDHRPGEGENGVVEVTIEDVLEEHEETELAVVDDDGLKERNGNPIDPQVIDGPGGGNPVFHLGGVLENVGDEPVTQEVTGTILDPSGTEVLNASETVGPVDPGDEVHLGDPGGENLQFEPAQYEGNFEYGTTYNYTIETQDDELDDPGSFYYGMAGSNFNVTDIDTSETSDNATVTATITNRGVEDGTQYVSLEVESINGTANQSVDLEYGSSTTVEWTLNRSVLPAGSSTVTVSTEDDSDTDSVTGNPIDAEDTFIVEDGGVGDDYIVEIGTEATFEVNVTSYYLTDGVTEDVELSIPGANPDVESKEVTLDSGETTTLEFDVDVDRDTFSSGTAYEYNVTTDSTGFADPGTFFVGEPGSEFELSNPNVSIEDDEDFAYVTADLENIGVENGSQDVEFDLEYLDPMPDELVDEGLYDDIPLEDESVTREPGEIGTIALPINQTLLLDGPYEATIWTDDAGPVSTTFEITAGVDPDTAGLDDIENATVEISIVSSQVSGINRGDHQLGTMTLEVLTERDGVAHSEHTFQNTQGGNNVNTYPAWEEQSQHTFNTTLEIEEKSTLTLASRSYGTPNSHVCDVETANRVGGGNHIWCTDIDTQQANTMVDPVDATADEEEQNLRVRTAEDNELPDQLEPGNEEQLSLPDMLEDINDPAIDRDSLWSDGELDLRDNEFLFIFETTIECGYGWGGTTTSACSRHGGMNDQDALWNYAIEEGPNDPNFNDLVVYVRVERADVDPGTPEITITPAESETGDFGGGTPPNGGTEPADSELVVDDGIDGTDGPELGPGQASDEDGDWSRPSGIDVGSDHIVIG